MAKRDPKGHTRDECVKIIEEAGFEPEDFWVWIYGQTAYIDDDGDIRIFQWDLQRWLDWKNGGRKPLWD